jgi:hypothetical protein
MSVFFAGRLLITPTSMSVVDDSGLANKNLTVGNVVALIGACEGGQPDTALRFGSPSQATAVLRSGELLDAVLKAFDPSNETGGPSEVVAIRVNPAVQAALMLQDVSSANVISILSSDYGLYTNQIKVKVENATNTGKKVTTQFGNDYYVGDDLYRQALTLQYSGAQATANITVTNGTVTLQAPNGNDVASIDLNVYKTVQQLVDRINSVSGFAASVTDGNGQKPALNGLDSVAAVDVKSAPYVVRADLQAVIDWLNGTGEGFLDATRVANAGTVPANIAFTYLAGGSDGTVTNTEWSNAFTALQQIDVQWITPISGDPSIHAMADAHAQFMSTVGKMERRANCGTVASTSDAAAIAAAKNLNSDRTSLCHIGYYDFNSDGVLTLYPPYMAAAAVSGAFAGSNPGTPLTNKTLKFRGLERNLRNPTDTDQLIKGGVLCIENTAKGYKVVQSISTWLVNDNYNRKEISTGVCLDFTARNVRDALDVLRGQKGSPTLLARAASITESTLSELARAEPQGPGILVGDKINPPFRNIEVNLDADVLRVQYEAQPAIGVNYVLQTIFAKAYVGSATA